MHPRQYKNVSDASIEEIGREIKGFGDDLKGLQTAMQKDLTEVRKLAEEAKAAGTSERPETKQAIDALSASVAEKYAVIDASLKEQKDRAEQIELAMKRVTTGGASDKDRDTFEKSVVDFYQAKAAASGNTSQQVEFDKVDSEGYKAWANSFKTYLRSPDERAIDQKALSVGSNPDGGYLVPTAISSRIIGKIYEASPIRQLAHVETIGTSALEIPIDQDEAGAGWVGEEQARPETSTPQLGVQRIPVHEIYAKPKATQKLLEDAAINVENWLAGKVADKFARVEAAAFLNGDGVLKPRGLLTYDSAAYGTRNRIFQTPSGDANLLTPDAIVAMPFLLKSAYLANARWLMKRSTVAAIMLFKDLNDQYIWRPSFQAGQPSLIGGFPLEMVDDMPAVAAGALSVAFGDFNRAYTILDRLGITTLRDPYSSKPFVEFYSRKRVGGDVVDFEAYVVMKIASS